MKKSIFLLYIVLCISCTQEVKKGTSLPLSESIEMDTKSENIILEDVSIVPLETTDKSLLGECRIVDICKGKIIVKDINSIYVFNEKTGAYESKLDKLGNGPEEYSSLSDVAVDCLNQLLYVLDGKGYVKVYGYDGNFQKVYKNDSIVSFEILENSNFIAFNRANGQYKYDINLYDNDWNIVKHMRKRYIKEANYKDVIEIKDFDIFNGIPYFTNADTIYQIENTIISPSFYIDKGKLSLPFEIFTDIKRKKERASYIWGDYGILAGDSYFLRFYHDNKIYYDIWNISSMKLIYRNIVNTPTDARGISILIDNKHINIWPSFVKNDMVYCVLMDGEVEKLGYTESNEGNPIIITGKIKYK